MRCVYCGSPAHSTHNCLWWAAHRGTGDHDVVRVTSRDKDGNPQQIVFFCMVDEGNKVIVVTPHGLHVKQVKQIEQIEQVGK